ncbi:MAG: hypothetical protein ACKVK3_13440 [Acidimicrobiales bacterium]
MTFQWHGIVVDESEAGQDHAADLGQAPWFPIDFQEAALVWSTTTLPPSIS